MRFSTVILLDVTGTEEERTKGEDAERGDDLKVESWACGEEPYDCHLYFRWGAIMYYSDGSMYGLLCRRAMRLFLIPVYQAHKPHVLAHKWFYEFGTRHNMSIKAGRMLRDMRML